MPIKRHNYMMLPHQAGFTLVELMVVVAVVGILAVIAAPSMAALTNANRLNSAAGELTSALQIARSEAIRRNARVSVCPTDGSATATTTCSTNSTWTQWAILDLSKTTVEDRVIRNETSTNSVKVSGPSAGIVFRPSGIIDAQATVVACMPVTQPAENRRNVVVMISGVVTSSNNNGGGTCP